MSTPLTEPEMIKIVRELWEIYDLAKGTELLKRHGFSQQDFYDMTRRAINVDFTVAKAVANCLLD